MPEFVPFPKLPRLKRDCIITEKLDGTNAAVHITDVPPDGNYHVAVVPSVPTLDMPHSLPLTLYAQSRNRFITPENDNYGFANWVLAHAVELATLGPGVHFGEWWGPGIQRGYGIAEKRFSLFNVERYKDGHRPECCHVVPTIYQGPFSTDAVDFVLADLRQVGSHASPNFMRPEGVVVYLPAARQSFKVTLENDEVPKGKVKEAA
jgi:hypothetical protein